MSSQVKKSGQCQLRDKKKHQSFSTVSLPTDSVIVHHVKIEIDLSEDFFHKLFVCILSNLIHGLWVHFTSKGVIVIYGISGLFKILPTRGICNLRGLARVGYYLMWVILNNPRMPYNVLSNIPKNFR
jgi:hypothetical protein